jgi:hypothetical protein
MPFNGKNHIIEAIRSKIDWVSVIQPNNCQFPFKERTDQRKVYGKNIETNLIKLNKDKT